MNKSEVTERSFAASGHVRAVDSLQMEAEQISGRSGATRVMAMVALAIGRGHTICYGATQMRRYLIIGPLSLTFTPSTRRHG